MPDVTQLLETVEQGETAASEKLLPLVYDELRKLATSRLAAEPTGQTQANPLATMRLSGWSMASSSSGGRREGISLERRPRRYAEFSSRIPGGETPLFAGLTIEQAAPALGISTSTADRYWSFARTWLYRHISEE